MTTRPVLLCACHRIASPCRSAFTEEFKDAKGFGWTVDERPPFNWKELIAKKVHFICVSPSVVSSCLLCDIQNRQVATAGRDDMPN